MKGSSGAFQAEKAMRAVLEWQEWGKSRQWRYLEGRGY